MRNKFAEVFYECAKHDERLVLVCADISPAGAIDRFRTEFSDRFFNVGVAEQSMIGIAAGMALRGLKPFCYTIATFALFRPYEFVRDDLCYQNLDVTVIGIGGGISYSTLGGTHHAMEDLAIASHLPNMTVLAPCDPLETGRATEWCALEAKGPVYMRLGRAGESNLTENAADGFSVGRIRYLKYGVDVAVVSCGTIVATAANIADQLEANGLSVSLITVSFIKPIDTDGLEMVLLKHSRVIVIEESVPLLGPFLEAKAAGLRVRAPECFALKDRFYHAHSSGPDLMKAHGLTYDEIYRLIH